MVTCDPDIIIEARFRDYVRYHSLSTGRRWEVHGTCAYRGNGHGACQEGAVNPDIGPPENRLDVPVAPGFTCPTCLHLRVEVV